MKKILALLTLASTLLTGCIAAVVVGSAAGLVVYDRRSLPTMEQDARIFHVIHSTVVQNPEFRSSRVAVTSFNRIVLLVGQTPAASLRVKAERVAQTTPQVGRVYNEITLGQPLSLKQQAQDSWITSQVKSNMLAREGLESGSIRVVTEGGVVYLLGIVTPSQANIAVDAARNVNGVVKVVKIFQYIR